MKKVVFFVILILCLFIINNFFHSIYRLWQKQDLIISGRNELAKEKQEQRKLEQELKKVADPAYIEEEARNKLFLIRPGEQIVVLPSPSLAPAGKERKTLRMAPVWLQWYRLFFEAKE
jgi:cell division protein DivIC